MSIGFEIQKVNFGKLFSKKSSLSIFLHFWLIQILPWLYLITWMLFLILFSVLHSKVSNWC